MRAALASLLVLASVWVVGCTAGDGPPSRDEPPRQGPVGGTGGSADPPDTASSRRRPHAVVYGSGRSAHPRLTLFTWGECPFTIQRVVRADRETLRVVGREAEDGCGPEIRRHAVSERLPRSPEAGGGRMTRIVVVSESPPFTVAARVLNPVV